MLVECGVSVAFMQTSHAIYRSCVQFDVELSAEESIAFRCVVTFCASMCVVPWRLEAVTL